MAHDFSGPQQLLTNMPAQGIAAANAEKVKVIHIVGTTGRADREARRMIHHALGDFPNHYVNFPVYYFNGYALTNIGI
jgi:hypothetical protein